MEKRQQKGVHANSGFCLRGTIAYYCPPPPSESYNYNEKNVVEKPSHGENKAKITPYNGKKIFLIFQGGVGPIERLLLPPPPAGAHGCIPPCRICKGINFAQDSCTRACM